MLSTPIFVHEFLSMNHTMFVYFMCTHIYTACILQPWLTTFPTACPISSLSLTNRMNPSNFAGCHGCRTNCSLCNGELSMQRATVTEKLMLTCQCSSHFPQPQCSLKSLLVELHGSVSRITATCTGIHPPKSSKETTTATHRGKMPKAQ